jgi:small GTP-binding protein
MSEYTKFDFESKRNRGSRLTKFLTVRNRRSSDDQRFEIMKMVPSYSNISPYNRIQDFNNKTKAVCLNTDLTMFLDECKVVIVGDANCGKSSLIKRFTTSKFEENYRPTIGVVLEQKYFDVLENGYNVGFWDMPGEEKFRQIFQSYYKNSNVIVVVFDLTRPSTLMNAARWMRDTLAANMSTDPIRFLVGTKSDLLSKRALDSLEAHASLVAQELDAEFCAVSAKDGSEVNNLFKRITSLSFENSVQKLIRPPDYHAHKNNISSEFLKNFSRFIAFPVLNNNKKLKIMNFHFSSLLNRLGSVS